MTAKEVPKWLEFGINHCCRWYEKNVLHSLFIFFLLHILCFFILKGQKHTQQDTWSSSIFTLSLLSSSIIVVRKERSEKQEGSERKASFFSNDIMNSHSFFLCIKGALESISSSSESISLLLTLFEKWLQNQISLPLNSVKRLVLHSQVSIPPSAKTKTCCCHDTHRRHQQSA